MLTRAALRRRHTLRYLQQAAETIQLPWLCPALALPPSSGPQKRHSSSRPSISRSKTSPAPRTQARHLASPAAVEDFDRSDDYIPFVYGDYPLEQRSATGKGELAPFDISQILMLKNAADFPPNPDDDSYHPGVNVRRNVAEIEATLDACLHVHRWDRAFTLLSQLANSYQHNPSRVQGSYNKFFAAIVDDLLQNNNMAHETRINEWIEVHLRTAGLDPDAYTLALRMKVALELGDEKKSTRTVIRYWDLANQLGLERQVLGMREIFEDRQLGKLSQILHLSEPNPLEPQIDASQSAESHTTTETESTSKNNVEVLQMEQKGLGLVSLRRSLAMFSGQPDATFAASPEHHWEHHLKNLERQRRLERDAIDSAMERWKAEYEKRAQKGITGGLAHGRIGALLWQWHEILAEKITREIKMAEEEETSPVTKSAQAKLRAEYAPFLELLPPEKLAAVTTIALMQMMNKMGASKPVKLVRLVSELGQAVETEYDATELAKRKEEIKSIKNKLRREANAPAYKDFVVWNERSDHRLHKRSKHHAATALKYQPTWSRVIHVKLGSILCELMFDTAKIAITRRDETTSRDVTLPQPVFLHGTSYQHGRKVGVVSLHEDFVKILVSQPAEHFIAKQLPMLCPPKPWTGFEEGGYLESKQPFLRMKSGEFAQKEYAVAAVERGDLDQLFTGVDILGRTGWRINKQVFNVMLQAWNSGEAIANLPPLNKEFPEVERPGENATPREKWDWFTNMRAVDNEKSALHSNRCFQNFQMEIAKAYLNETFYLPHNVDFRGRAYPMPPYLNQMGADNSRGVLLFDKGRELGEQGLRWLKIHLSNVYGFDKASLADRAQFPMDHLDDIYDSVKNPLGGRRWWLTAEDPWQCLATCFELTGALDSPDPTKYVSRLPIHQDGSCNGLQHYAALGGDIAGARQVNLEPGDKPADVYSGVCELVKAEIKQDAANGDSLAQMLKGRVTRKVVKQTVMTNVYGVTFMGAIRQVRKQVDDLMPDVKAVQLSGKASTYIAKKIFKGLGALFTGAHEIQYWLGDCANRISSSISPFQMDTAYKQAYDQESSGKISLTKKVLLREATNFRSTVIWTTPLKLPVVQPYRINKGQKIQTNLQNITLAQPGVADAVHRRKQLQAFPPNFIHSLDATHMVLSAIKADELGLTFSAVHDSFWTHAADVDTLSTLLRDAFIRMHSEDIVGRLAAEFQKRYEGYYYLAYTTRNSPLGKAITEYRQEMVDQGIFGPMQGAKAIAVRKEQELVRELRRNRLLASEDPKEREEGENMVTAATLFDKFDGEQYLSSKDSLGETAIGAVPGHVQDSTVQEAIHAAEGSVDVDMATSLDPLRDAVTNDDDGFDGDVDVATKTPPIPPVPAWKVQRDAFGQRIRRPRSQNGTTAAQVWLWLPLKFKPVPKKGDWNINRLRESTYFFS
ncbi:DNA-directed RNA polymerase [Exophiala xenobiotica]|nr:DNA-directed RNA polymerase [Exophiala xenobiotica]KAK5217400.1 DNA-directed RNA polymerase [Exophiala xenobiotica]KAK5264856.1 DNA-directed RNA polymerase [Exophiala xenobiotica]KAK5380595.1 DNA-directed RNA polymerase [Exophiala xenobiotica]KAK5429997.1 DNA-directed RNA polymerase [Exophiala xenobiotica]